MLIEPHNRYQSLQTEWEEPPLVWRDPNELVGEMFRFAPYKTWRKGGVTSPHNRTCFVGFALMGSRFQTRVPGWIEEIPKIFGIQSLIKPLSIPLTNAVCDEKSSLSQQSLLSQPAPAIYRQSRSWIGTRSGVLPISLRTAVSLQKENFLRTMVHSGMYYF
jgi:hypothetical protein